MGTTNGPRIELIVLKWSIMADEFQRGHCGIRWYFRKSKFLSIACYVKKENPQTSAWWLKDTSRVNGYNCITQKDTQTNETCSDS